MEGQILSELYRKIEVKDDLKDSFNTNIKNPKQSQKFEQKLVSGLELWKKGLKAPGSKRKGKAKEGTNNVEHNINMTHQQLLKLIGYFFLISF